MPHARHRSNPAASDRIGVAYTPSAAGLDSKKAAAIGLAPRSAKRRGGGRSTDGKGDKAGSLRLKMESQRSNQAKNVAMRGLVPEGTGPAEAYDPDSPVKGGEVSRAQCSERPVIARALGGHTLVASV